VLPQRRQRAGVEPNCVVERLKSPSDLLHDGGKKGRVLPAEPRQICAGDPQRPQRYRSLDGRGPRHAHEHTDLADESGRRHCREMNRAIAGIEAHPRPALDQDVGRLAVIAVANEQVPLAQRQHLPAANESGQCLQIGLGKQPMRTKQRDDVGNRSVGRKHSGRVLWSIITCMIILRGHKTFPEDKILKD